MSAFMRKVYNGFDTGSDIEPAAWREALRLMNEATVDGLSRSEVPPTHEEEFYRELKHSNEVFAAFKVHSMGEKMAAKLTTPDGKLKSFRQWAEDVRGISSHYVGSWLRTEYDTAVLRAHAAADWRLFERDKDIMPNLRWMPTTSPEPESTHRLYWQKKLTLPVDHPFWEKHHPGDRWNCKCMLEQTDEPANPEVLEDVEEIKPQRGLENNPGKDGHTFHDTHPYFPAKCSQCFAYKKSGFKNRMKYLFANKTKDCYNCPYIDRCIKQSSIHEYDNQRWEHTYVPKERKGYVVTEKTRIEEAKASKNEMIKFKKEMNMCKVAANNGHEIEYLHGNNRTNGQTFDINFDGIPTDLKSTDGYGNIVKYIGKAYKKQGAKAVLIEVAEVNKTLIEKFGEAKRKYSVKIFYYVKTDEIIHEFK